MEGITDGYKMRAEEEPRLEDEGMNHENGIMLLNFIADFWDLKVKIFFSEEGEDTSPIAPHHSVFIKV